MENIVTIIYLLFVAMSGILAWYQFKESNKIKKAEFINKIVIKLRFDEEMAEIMRKIDYGEECWYTGSEDFHNNPNSIESKIDKFLSYLSYICYLRATKNIT